MNWIWLCIYEGREFQTDEPENTNVIPYISKWGFGVYNWKLDDERNSIACISEVNDDLRYSGASPLIFLKHLNSFHIYIYNPFEKWHPFKIRKQCRWWGVKITINNYSGSPFSEVLLVFPPGHVCNFPR